MTMTKVTLRENATLNLVDSRLDYNGFQGGSSYLSVYSNSKLILSNSILGYDPHKTGVANPEDYTHTNTNADFFGPRIAIYGSAEISNSTIYTGPGQGTHEGFDVLGNATATLNGSVLHTNLINVGSRLEEGRLSAGTDKSNLSAVLTLNNAKVDNIQYRGDYTSVSGICVGADNWAGRLNIENGSEIDMTVVKHTDGREQGLAVGAKGTVNVSDSSVKVLKVSNNGAIMIQDSTFSAGSITNNGTFTVSGESTLNIGTLSGAGTVTFANGSVTTFEGTNVIEKNLAGVEGFDFVVNKGASLRVNRAGYVLGYGRDITVYGELSNVLEMTEEDLSGVLVSFAANNVNGGFSIGGTGTHVLDVHDARVDLGSSSWKNAYGTYTWSFDNSYVKATSFGNLNPANDTAAKWDVTFKSSRLSANYVKVAAQQTLNFKEDSVAVTGGLAVNGELNIDCGSSVTVTAYQNNAVGAQDEHGDISGTVNIAGTLNIQSNAVTCVELLNGGAMNVNGGTLNLTNKNGTVNNILVTEGAGLSVSDGGTVIAKNITNNASIIVCGNATMKFDEMKTIATEAASGMENYTGRFMVGFSPIKGNANATLKEETGTHLTLDSVSGQGIAINTFRTYIEDSDLTLKDNLTITVLSNTTMKDHRSDVGIYNGKIDLGGNTLKINGQANIGNVVLSSSTEAMVEINGTSGKSGRANLTFDGGFGADAASDYVTVENNVCVVAKEVNQFNMYAGTVTINGQVIVENAHSDSNIGLNTSGELAYSPYGSQVVVSGEGASLEIRNVGVTIHGILDGAKNNSGLTIKNGATASFGGIVKNHGTLDVGTGSTLTANEITGSGDVVLAGTINVVGGVFTADDLTIVAGATLNFGAAEKGVTLMATREVISFDFNTLTIIATNVKAGELDLSQVITDGNGANALLAALAGMEEAPEFTVIDSNTGKTFTAVYSSENGGTVSVIPEPSMFGLFAGLGALLLVGTRRRRK